MILYFFNKIFQMVISWLKNNEGLDDLAARLVGLADHRRVSDRGVLHEAGFDFRRADAVAGSLDHVVRAPLVPEVAVLIHAALVPGAAPVADELLARGVRILPVLEEKHRIIVLLYRYFAQFPARYLRALFIHDRDLVAGIRPADRAGLHRPRGLAVADHVVDLGLAEHLVDRHAELLARPLDHRHAHRFAGAHDGAQVEAVFLFRFRHRLHHQLERGGEQE
jgi:hypothetical protein